MQTRRIDSRIVGRMRRRMDPSVPRGIPLNRGGKSFRFPSRQTRQRREVGKNGGEGLNRARQSPRISPRSISFSCFSFQIFSLLGGFFLCGAGSGIPSFHRNGPSLRIEIENHAEFRVFERHNIIEIIETRKWWWRWPTNGGYFVYDEIVRGISLFFFVFWETTHKFRTR